MPEIEHGQSDAESLARKLRGLESQLTANERRLLKRILAAAAVTGIALGVGNTAADAATAPVDSASSGTATAQAAESVDSMRAQFAEAFTPGEEWTASGGQDIGLPH